MRASHGIAEEIQLARVLEQLAGYPTRDREFTGETERRLPTVSGLPWGAFIIVDPRLSNPHTDDWERALRLFDLMP